jgi:hypothetical protein
MFYLLRNRPTDERRTEYEIHRLFAFLAQNKLGYFMTKLSTGILLITKSKLSRSSKVEERHGI